MDVRFSSEAMLTNILEILAVLGHVRKDWLPGLMGRKYNRNIFDRLIQKTEVILVDDWLLLTPQKASALLTSLENNTPSYFRELHKNAINFTASYLQERNQSVEKAFLTAFERLANRLLLDDPIDFVQLVEQAGNLPLVSQDGKQKMAYFQALALVKADRYEEAIQFFNQLLAMSNLIPEIMGRALNSRANCHFITGHLDKALEDYQASLGIWRAANNSLRQGIALLNLGIIAYELQDYVQAEGFLVEATFQFELANSAQWLASARNELGLVYRDRGNWEQAIACFELAANQRKKDGAIDSLGSALNNIGEVLLLQGSFEKAQEKFNNALEAMNTRLWAIDAHLNLGLIHQMWNDQESAQSEYEMALQLSDEIGRRDNLALIHYRLGDVFRRKKEFEQALEHHRLSVMIVEMSRQPLNDEGLKISLLGRWQQAFETLVLLCLDMGLVEEAFLWAERSRARAFAESIAARVSIVSESEEPGSTNELKNEDVATAKELQSALEPDTIVFYFFTTGVLDRDIPMLQALPASGPLPEILLVPGKTILFLITFQSITAHICPIDPNLLTSHSRRGEDGSQFTPPAVLKRMQEVLLKDVEFKTDWHQVKIIPHGPLHCVPFCALPGLRDGPPVSYSPSATLLARSSSTMRERQSSKLSLLAIGFDGSSERQRLHHSEMEASLIAEFSGGDAWIGPDAKKDRLSVIGQNYRQIHFSCHGWFNHASPLDSFLETGKEERITAREIIETWKLYANLVTLSACRTGVSRILRSDEPMGLVRAFLTVGARFVLASLWPLEDLPTFLLMWQFYAELDHLTDNPVEALTIAQSWLRNITNREVKDWWRHHLPYRYPSLDLTSFLEHTDGEHPFEAPFYWAGFFLVGS